MSHYSNSMKWNQVLFRWIKGYYPKFSNIKDEFIWRTSPYYENSIYKEEFINVSGLDKNSNYSAFSSKFTKNIKYVVAFSNLSNDTMLVCPVPIQSKNYSSIYSFNKNAFSSFSIFLMGIVLLFLHIGGSFVVQFFLLYEELKILSLSFYHLFLYNFIFHNGFEIKSFLFFVLIVLNNGVNAFSE